MTLGNSIFLLLWAVTVTIKTRKFVGSVEYFISNTQEHKKLIDREKKIKLHTH